MINKVGKLNFYGNRSLLKNRLAMCGLISIFSALLPFAAQAECARSSSGVGEVVTSLLNPTQFAKLYGSDWSLLDGSISPNNPINSYLPVELQNENGTMHLPDARGKFFRMLNHGENTENTDPDIHRTIGSFQADENKEHSHKYQRPRGYVSGAGGHARAKPDGPTIDTGPSGGAEARPKNVAVNFFVRVRRTDAKCN